MFQKNRISWVRLGTRFEKSDFSPKSDFLGSGFLGHVWAHGLRNPIFPKNRISWALSGWSGNFRSPALVQRISGINGLIRG
jgi:hypothetical protein